MLLLLLLLRRTLMQLVLALAALQQLTTVLCSAAPLNVAADAESSEPHLRNLTCVYGRDNSSFFLRIGGIFKNNDSAAYFADAVQRINYLKPPILPSGYCLTSSAVVLGNQGALKQIDTICKDLIPRKVYALVLGELPEKPILGKNSDTLDVPRTPALISTYYQLPLLTATGQADETITEQDTYRTVLRLLPHKAHEAEVWCAILSRFRLTHVILIAPIDAVGTEYETRMRHCWWKGNVIRFVQFLHFSAQATKRSDFAQVIESVKYIDYRVVLVYAESYHASMLLEEARSLNATGTGWIWIVSESAARADNLPIGTLITVLKKPSENYLIDEAVALLTHTFALMLNTTWDSTKLRKLSPPKACISSEDNKWSKEGINTANVLRRGFYLNHSTQTAVAFDALGYRMISSYSLVNVQPSGERVTVGSFDETTLYIDEKWTPDNAPLHEPRPVNVNQTIDFGVFMTVDTAAEINYAAHADDAKIDSALHSFVEAVQKKVYANAIERAASDYDRLVDNLIVNDSAIVWPGGGPIIRPQFVSRWHLRIVTAESKPYVYVFKNPENLTIRYFDQFGNLEHHVDSHEHSEEFHETLALGENDLMCPGLRCTHTPLNSTETFEYCCFGYCIDLLIELAKAVNITFDLHLSRDGGFGHPIEIIKDDGTASDDWEDKAAWKKRAWTGMVGELDDESADMAVAPLSIIAHRNRVVDFTKPFMYPTLSILTRKGTSAPTLVSFLQPFETSLWCSIFLLVNGLAAIMYLLERLSPFGWFRFNEGLDRFGERYRSKIQKTSAAIVNSIKTLRKSRPKKETKEDKAGRPVTFAEATWLSWGIVLSTGAGEKLPRSFSARTFTIFCTCFAMIVVASYTANLAAFLVLDRDKDTINGIDDARLRNPSNLFKFATVRNSDVEMYFKKNVELNTMYHAMQSRLVGTVEEAIELVRNGSLNAFIWETSRLLHETALDCQLTLASGGSFGKGQYAIALRRQLKRLLFYDWRVDLMENYTEAARTRKAESATVRQESLVDKLSMAILKMRDSGYMETLDEKWVLSNLENIGIDQVIAKSFERDERPLQSTSLVEEEVCPTAEPSPTLGLDNIVDIFILICCGTAVSTVSLIFELLYYRCRRRVRPSG